jgi:hypothetical protein
MENVLLNAITFSLPARQFEISSSVTINETLPKVNEFVLRLIRICREIEGEEIARYFGFSGKEARLVLDALKDQSLIRMDGELIRLTEYAESKFYTDDDIPRFSVVKPRTDNIDFDLLTFNPIAGPIRKKTAAFLVEIPCESDRISSSDRLAEQAYQRNFRKILRDKERTKDVIDIYKISNIKSKKLFEIPLEVTFALSEQLEIERLIDYDEDATEDFRLAVEAAVSDVLQTNQPDQNDLLIEFIDYFDDPVLRKFIGQDGFDFERYIREIFDSRSANYLDARIPIVGNIYMPNNQETVLRDISEVLKSRIGGINLMSCVWMAPDYRFWGRTTLLDDFYTKLQKLLPQPKKKIQNAIQDLLLLFPGISETKWILERQLRSNPAKNIHFYSGSVMGGRIEILLLPTSFACVLFHLRPPGNSMALIPIGFTTTDSLIVEKAKKLIGLSTDFGRAYVGPAHIDRTKPLKTDTFEDTFGFLNYSVIGGSQGGPLFGQPAGSQCRERSTQTKTQIRKEKFLKDIGKYPIRDHSEAKSIPNVSRSLGRKISAQETDDQIIFRSGERGEITFKVSKNQRWRGLLPLPSVNNRAITELAERINYDLKKLLGEMRVMSIYVKDLTPAEAAQKISEDLGIPVAEVWRYFIDAMYIVEH